MVDSGALNFVLVVVGFCLVILVSGTVRETDVDCEHELCARLLHGPWTTRGRLHVNAYNLNNSRQWESA